MEPPTVIWMQLGIVNEEAARRVKETGCNVVMDRCMRLSVSASVGKAFLMAEPEPLK